VFCYTERNAVVIVVVVCRSTVDVSMERRRRSPSAAAAVTSLPSSSAPARLTGYFTYEQQGELTTSHALCAILRDVDDICHCHSIAWDRL